MSRITVLIFAILCATNHVGALRILGVFPMPARSHYILGNSLMRGLAERGHDVTMISPFVEKNPPKNGTYRDIVLSDFINHRNDKDVNMFELEGTNIFLVLPMMIMMMTEATELTLNHSSVQELLKNPDEKFDVVIVEQFMNEAHKMFASHYNAPLILLSTLGANYWVNSLAGNPAPPSYVPDILLSYSSQMTFKERLVNGFTYIFNFVVHHCYLYPTNEKMMKKYFPNPPHLDDLIYNASIILLNSHPSINQPVPHVPNMIEIGGYHVKPPKKLPDDLQKFLDNAKEGVIYFSLGSNLQSAELPAEKRDSFLKTFAKLKQKILWKWEEDTLPGQPPNVKLGKWLPQQDILAHPNVKLFITHGGLLSTTETIYHGKPVLAIPIFGDQKTNAQVITNSGFGLTIQYRDITEESLTEKLNELLNNPKYAENAKMRSEIFHDRPNKPMDTATYWVEYVARHGGTPHLRVAALDLPWYKYHLLDVLAFVFITSLLISYIFYKISKKICRRFCRKCKAAGEKKGEKVKTN